MTTSQDLGNHQHHGKIPFFVTEKVWYIYRTNEVDGPFEIQDLLRLSPRSASGEDIFVSRAGLDRWYTLQEFSDLYHAHDSFTLDHRRDIDAFQKQFQEKVNFLENLQIQSGSGSVTRPSPLVPEKRSSVLNSRIATSLSDQQRPVVGVSLPRDTSTNTKVQTPSPDAVVIPKGSQYFLYKNKYRLGNIRSSMMQSFVKFPLTLGLFWGAFLKTSTYELLWHVYSKHNYRQVLPPIIFAYIPGFHILYAYRLGRLIQVAEIQNQYRKTSPTLAAILAIVPPLGMWYLQSKMNFHWKMHAKHAGLTIQ